MSHDSIYETKVSPYNNQGVNLTLMEHVLRYLSDKPNQRILDIGCGSGNNGFVMQQHGHTVWGIDVAQEAIRQAERKLDAAFCLDIETGDPSNVLRHHMFDLILLADVIEHLRAPKDILNRYSTYLNQNGVMIISTPNIANYTIRWNLLKGKFDYTDTGILDNTHVHFFTMKSVKKLIEESNMDIVSFFVSTNRKVGEVPILETIENSITQAFKTLFGYQFIIFVKPKRR